MNRFDDVVCHLQIDGVITNTTGIFNLQMNVRNYDNSSDPNESQYIKCLPEGTYISITGSSPTPEMQKAMEEKTWMFSFCITILTIAATYFTINELKKVANSLEQREQVGQRENYAKKLSLISNSLICMWNMAYSLTFFVCAMQFPVFFPLTYNDRTYSCTLLYLHFGFSC